jgi:hypothetical protein
MSMLANHYSFEATLVEASAVLKVRAQQEGLSPHPTPLLVPRQDGGPASAAAASGVSATASTAAAAASVTVVATASSPSADPLNLS